MATKKRTLPLAEQQRLRNILQIATVRALMDSRRAVAEDLARWLPSTWPMNAAVATEMLGVAVAELVAGTRTMGEVMQLMQEQPRG
jgi:hypothetical protein